jgi:tRNA(His) 5'-end guanylyltransferase
MSNKDSMGNRLKAYENCYRFYLPRRLPVIVRLDMRAGHSFTKGFARPYDEVFAFTMRETAKKLCENISGVRFAYTQSDEISLVLVDYENINTEPWFGNNLQKIVSISASMATLFFNKNFEEAIRDEYFDWYTTGTVNDEKEKLLNQHSQAYNNKLCVFDARAFVLPREEIFNALYWRQLDCKRNSIQLLGQANFSHSQLQNKNCDEIQEMLWQEKGINWANEPNWFKNGVAIYKKPTIVTSTLPDGKVVETERNKWYVDMKTPVFTTDKSYIEKHITFNN